MHLGRLDTEAEDQLLVDTEVVVYAESAAPDVFMKDPVTSKPLKLWKVWSESQGVHYFGGDTEVVITSEPRPAGHPAEIAKLAVDGTRIVEPQDGAIRIQGETHDFIWESDALDGAVTPYHDAEVALETLLYAISVAPAETLAVLHAALARSYFDVLDFYEKFGEPCPEWTEDGYRKPKRQR